MPGSYLTGVYEPRPLPYANVGYDHPEDGQTVVNVSTVMLIRLRADEHLDVCFGAPSGPTNESTSGWVSSTKGPNG